MQKITFLLLFCLFLKENGYAQNLPMGDTIYVLFKGTGDSKEEKRVINKSVTVFRYQTPELLSFMSNSLKFTYHPDNCQVRDITFLKDISFTDHIKIAEQLQVQPFPYLNQKAFFIVEVNQAKTKIILYKVKPIFYKQHDDY